MRVSLDSYTQPTEKLKALGVKTICDYIAYVARVSNPENQHNVATSKKLLEYLKKNKHWSPFEMASICMEIETTRDIAHQIIRHRSFSFQEYSQRYSAVTIDFSSREARLQDMSNRQNSISSEDEELERSWKYYQREVAKQSERAYTWALTHGIAKEQARVVLPEGLTPTRLYMNGTVRSWIHYVELRSANGTQKEHKEIAIECGKILESLGL